MEYQHRLCVVWTIVQQGDPPNPVEGGQDSGTTATRLLCQHWLSRVSQHNQLAGLHQKAGQILDPLGTGFGQGSLDVASHGPGADTQGLRGLRHRGAARYDGGRAGFRESQPERCLRNLDIVVVIPLDLAHQTDQPGDQLGRTPNAGLDIDATQRVTGPTPADAAATSSVGANIKASASRASSAVRFSARAARRASSEDRDGALTTTASRSVPTASAAAASSPRGQRAADDAVPTQATNAIPAVPTCRVATGATMCRNPTTMACPRPREAGAGSMPTATSY